MAYDFEQFKKDVKRTSEKVSEKAKELTDTAKLKVDIKTKERELDKLYCALGKVYFAAHQNDDEETIPEAVMFRGIKRAEAELAQLNQELVGDDDEDDDEEDSANKADVVEIVADASDSAEVETAAVDNDKTDADITE